MELNEKQYERIALWLDGQPADLTADERAAAEEIRSGEAALRIAMPVEAVPARAMAAARRKVRAATVRHIAVRGRFIGVAAAGAAVAAALVIAWTLRVPNPPVRAPGMAHKVTVPPEVWAQAIGEPLGGEAIQGLARELDGFEAELAVFSAPVPADWQVDAVQHEIDDFWKDDSSPSAPDS